MERRETIIAKRQKLSLKLDQKVEMNSVLISFGRFQQERYGTKVVKTNWIKKIVAISMGVILAGTLLTGCGRKPEDNVSQSTEKSESISGETSSEQEQSAGKSQETEADSPAEVLRVGSLKGPTSMGLLFLKQKSEKEETENKYEFTMTTAADELLMMMAKGDLDIALVPANVAGVLYQKTEGGISVIDINTLGVLYMVSGSELNGVEDLRGKTIYLTGKGTTPDYVLNYILQGNGIGAEDVTLEYKSEATEVAALLAEKPEAIGLLPQPFVTAACMQNEALKVVIDCNEEWNKLQGEGGSSLVTGVTVIRNEYLNNNKEAVAAFLAEHKESIQDINEYPEEGAELAVEAGIVAKAPIAQKAIPQCNITYLDGETMKQALSGYLEVLFEQNPESVGGKLPEADFYYAQ